MLKEITTDEVKQHIKSRVTIDDHTGCWEWKLQKRGSYGILDSGTRAYKFLKEGVAHRASYRAFVGPIPEGQVIRHRCNNKLCCNPEHLTPGTQSQNMFDKYEPFDEMTVPALKHKAMHLERMLAAVQDELKKRLH